MKILESPDPKESKKTLKIAVEKKRRVRINQSLEELRSLLLETTRNDRLLNPRVEKAEILDFTVQYLKRETLQRSHAKEESARQRYEDGFKECLYQATGSMRDLSPAAASQVVADFHLYLADGGRSMSQDWGIPLVDMPSHPKWAEDNHLRQQDGSSRTSSKPPWPVHHPQQNNIPFGSNSSPSPPQHPTPEQNRSAASTPTPALAGDPIQRLHPKVADLAEKLALPQSIWRPWP